MLDKVENDIVHVGEPYLIKISKIKPNPNQPRRYFSEASLVALANSIQEEGQETPISVKKGDAPGEFMILDGERRWRAHKIIWDRTGVEPTIKAFMAIVKNEKEFFKRSVIANLHKEDLTELDEAAALAKLHEDGMSLAELANMLDKSMTYVTNRIKINGLPDNVKALMSYDLPRDNRLAVTVAIDIALSTKNQEMRFELAQEAVQRQLGVHDTRVLIQTRVPSYFSDLPAASTPNATATQSDYMRNRGSSQVVENNKTYRKLSSFLGSSKITLSKLLQQDLEAVFHDRLNDKEERQSFDNMVGNLIVDLRLLQTKLRGM